MVGACSQTSCEATYEGRAGRDSRTVARFGSPSLDPSIRGVFSVQFSMNTLYLILTVGFCIAKVTSLPAETIVAEVTPPQGSTERAGEDTVTPASTTEHEAKAEPETEPTPEPEASSPEPESESEPSAEYTSEPESESEPTSPSEPSSEPEPESEPTTSSETSPEPESESEPSSPSETSEPESESEPESSYPEGEPGLLFVEYQQLKTLLQKLLQFVLCLYYVCML